MNGIFGEKKTQHNHNHEVFDMYQGKSVHRARFIHMSVANDARALMSHSSPTLLQVDYVVHSRTTSQNASFPVLQKVYNRGKRAMTRDACTRNFQRRLLFHRFEAGSSSISCKEQFVFILHGKNMLNPTSNEEYHCCPTI